MAYTAPTALAVDFQFPGTAYSPQYGETMDLQWVPSGTSLVAFAVNGVGRAIWPVTGASDLVMVFKPETSDRGPTLTIDFAATGVNPDRSPVINVDFAVTPEPRIVASAAGSFGPNFVLTPFIHGYLESVGTCRIVCALSPVFTATAGWNGEISFGFGVSPAFQFNKNARGVLSVTYRVTGVSSFLVGSGGSSGALNVGFSVHGAGKKIASGAGNATVAWTLTATPRTVVPSVGDSTLYLQASGNSFDGLRSGHASFTVDFGVSGAGDFSTIPVLVIPKSIPVVYVTSHETTAYATEILQTAYVVTR